MQSEMRRKAEAEALEKAYDIFYSAETDYYLYYRYKNVIKKHIIYDFSKIATDVDARYTVRLFGQGVIKENINHDYDWLFRNENEISEYKFFIERQDGRCSYSDIFKKDIIGICHINETSGFNQNNAKIFLYD